jgi:4-phosphopantoate--beta-alanine ligase
MATISIVDNIVRAVPNLTSRAEELSRMSRNELLKIMENYDNNEILRQAVEEIQAHLAEQFEET